MQRWHEGRARGQLERIERVEDCGTTVYQLACKSCGVVAPGVRERTCAAWRYCIRCRGTRVRDYHDRINAAREEWLQRKRGFERERFLSLTLPHAGVAGDVRNALSTWERFTRSTRRWITARHSKPLFAFVRTLELTPSDGGHAHLHAWVGSPFLPYAVLRVLWGRALGCEGPLNGQWVPVRPIAEALAELPDERSRRELLRAAGWRGKRACDGDCCHLRPSRRRGYLRQCKHRHYVPNGGIDIRAVKGDVAAELVKYLVKDIDQGELVDPLTAANLIEATEGVRVVAASIHFWVLAQRCCEHCDAPAVYLVLVCERDEAAPQPRGPPA